MQIIRLWIAFFKNCLARELEFRGHFIFYFLIDIAWYSIQILFFEVMFLYTPGFAGLSKSHAYVFLGTLFMVDSINMMLIATNFWKFPTYINTGELDFFLLKPVSVFFLAFFRYPNIASILNFIVSIIVFSIGITMLTNSISIIQWISWFTMCICGSIIMLCLETIVASCAFHIVNSSGIQNIFHTIYQIATRPDGMYSKRIQRIFLTVFPISIIASVPSRMLWSEPDISLMSICIISTSVFAVFSRWFFMYSLSLYDGASS